MSWSFERLTDAADSAGGGIVWTGQELLYSVPGADTILSWNPETEISGVFRRFACGADGLALGPGGSVYVCQSTSRRTARLDPDGSAVVLEYRLDGQMHNFPRDISVDADGAVWFTDRSGGLRSPGPQMFAFLDHSSVLRLVPQDDGWELTRMTHDTTAPSAILVEDANTRLYVSDGGPEDAAPELRIYPVSGESLGKPETIRIPQASEITGLCEAADGRIVACAGAELLVLSPDGALLSRQSAPVDLVRCCLGGDTLYLTSAQGALWRVLDTDLRELNTRSGVLT